MCIVTYAIMKNSSELLLKATRVGKSSDFSSENWVRIYSSVPEVSNVKTLTLLENLPASKPWTSFSNSRLTRTESICLNHLQASAKASLGHLLSLWQEESVLSRTVCSKCRKHIKLLVSQLIQGLLDIVIVQFANNGRLECSVTPLPPVITSTGTPQGVCRREK